LVVACEIELYNIDDLGQQPSKRLFIFYGFVKLEV